MRHRKLAWTLVALFVAGTIGLSLVYDNWSFGDGRRPIRIAVDIWVGFAPLFLAQEKGFFEDRGVDVEIRVMKGAEEIRAGLAAGELDGQTTSLDTILMQNDQGIPAVAVLALDRSKGGDGIVARHGISSVAGLRGRTVAFQPATPSHFFLLFHLHEAGMTIQDIKALPMDSGDAGAAFMAGKVDAAVTWEPWLGQAAEAPDGHLLVSSAEETLVIVDVLAFRPEVLRDRGSDVRAIAGAWDDAVRYWRDNPDEANRIMAAQYSLDPGEFADMISGLQYLTGEDNQALAGTLERPGPLVELVRRINEVFRRNDITTQDLPLKKILAFDYL